MKKCRKKSILSIAISNLNHRKIRSIFMILFILLQSFTLFTSIFLSNSMEKGIDNVTQRMGADLIVIPDEYSNDLQDTLFMGQPSTMYFDREWSNKLEKVNNVSKISSQLYIQTLESTCCDEPTQLIAFDPKSDFVIKPWLEKGNIDLKKGEVVVGYNITANQGEIIKFYDTEFKIADKLEKSGSGYDNSVFMSFDTVYELKDSQIAKENLKLDNMENTISMVLIDSNDDYSNERLAFDINTNFDKDNITAYTANSLFSGVIDKVKQFSVYSSIFSVLLFIVTSMALISIFIITINERKREIGIYYTLGGNKKQITAMIVCEGLVISTIGGVLGVLSSVGLITIFKNLISISMDIPYLSTINLSTIVIGIICLILALLTGLIASIISVYQISKQQPCLLIRENE